MLASPWALSFLLGFFAGLADGAAPLIFAHLAFCPARMLASPWALSFLLGFFAGLADGAAPLIFAHLAFCAARILALPAALTFRLLGASIVAVSARPPRS